MVKAPIVLALAIVSAPAIAAAQSTPPPQQTPVPRPSPFPGARPPATTTPPRATSTTTTPPAAQKEQQSAATKPVTPPAQSGPRDGSTIDPRLAGVPIYPGAELLSSFDAGRGQHIFLFGSSMPYSDVVAFYKSQLRTGGSEIWRAPATHQFDWGQYRSETMSFRPSIVVKDHTWNSSPGYLHVSGTTEKRYPTVIQIVR